MPTGAGNGQAELERFVRFCAALRTQQGEPLLVEPFQRQLLADYFAGVRESLVLLPKKNGKTTLLAALALYHLLAVPDAECVVGAASREQASILYEQAVGFVTRSERLQGLLAVQGGYRRIRNRADMGRVRVLAADVDTADGVIPTLALVDELHRHKSADLYGVFRDGLGPRAGQMVTISTAGEYELTPLGQLRAAARRLPGLTSERGYTHASSEDGSFAMHEWALEPEDDTSDMALVKLVNPASWQTEEELAQRYASPSTLPWHWQRFACGLWTGAESWWVRPATWAAAVVADRLRAGDEVCLGFDGSRYGDATALVACRLADGLLQPLGVWEAPTGAHEWEVPAGAVDAAVAMAHETFRVVRGYYDPPLWQTEIDGWAREYGDTAVIRYPTNRSRFMAATERFRTDLTGGQVPHTGHDRLTRHVLAATVKEARGGYWLEKATGEHIDLAIAAVLAYEARSDVLASADDDRHRSEYAFL